MENTIENLMQELKNSPSDVYKKFFSANKTFFASNPENRKVHKQTDDSFAFDKCPGEVFNIVNPSFCKGFHDVINGEGQERFKINTLHSSSLLGLLCFYKVSKDNVLRIPLPFNGKEIEFCFDEVRFEKTNPVFSNSRGKSSIDIALYGNAKGDRVALYLESKFTEYLHFGANSTSDKLNQYKPFYEVLKSKFNKNDIEYREVTDKNGIHDGKLHLYGRHYCEGIKQMVSHYIGALHSDDFNRVDKIYLAPLFFDFSKFGFGNTELEDYRGQYEKLSKGICELKNKLENSREDFFKTPESKNLFVPESAPSRIVFSEKVFTYQQFFREWLVSSEEYQLDQTVRGFYQL